LLSLQQEFWDEPGDGHLQAGLMAVTTHTKAAFNDPPFFPCMVQAGVAERPAFPWVFVGALVPEQRKA